VAPLVPGVDAASFEGSDRPTTKEPGQFSGAGPEARWQSTQYDARMLLLMNIKRRKRVADARRRGQSRRRGLVYRPAVTTLLFTAALGLPGQRVLPATTALNVCKLLPARQVARITGTKVTGTKERTYSLVVSLKPLEHAAASQCQYDTPADPGSPSVLVAVVYTYAAQSYKVDRSGEFVTPTTVAHLGGKAFFDTANGLYVLSGRYEVEVSGTPSENDQSMSQDVAIAKAVLKALHSPV
jgi:hypothetical protein